MLGYSDLLYNNTIKLGFKLVIVKSVRVYDSVCQYENMLDANLVIYDIIFIFSTQIINVYL